jgi:PAS domain S-box-containing protein
LTQAAHLFTPGTLDIYTPVNSGIPEIDQLTRHFDLARRQLRQTLTITQQEMKHIERLLSSIQEGVIALDGNGMITFFNPDAEKIFGYQAADVVHRHYSHIFVPAPGEVVTLKEFLNKPSGERSSQRLTILDARKRPLLLSITISGGDIDLVSGNVTERVLVVRDVTEEEAVGRLRYNFLANVAHEFRTPLAGIAATSEILSEDAPDLSREELTRLVETIRLSTLHLQTLVDNLLESTIIEAGCFKVHCRPIHLPDVVQNTVDLMSPLLNRREQQLEIDLPPELPMLWADANRLTQVLVNLLSNASKFSPMGSKIELKVTRVPQWIKISVLDSGPGLPAGNYVDLFKRFVTGYQPHETQYGIGLGLSVVKSIVELHGGGVGAENRPEGGANVWFTIPLQPPEEKEKQ